MPCWKSRGEPTSSRSNSRDRINTELLKASELHTPARVDDAFSYDCATVIGSCADAESLRIWRQAAC